MRRRARRPSTLGARPRERCLRVRPNRAGAPSPVAMSPRSASLPRGQLHLNRGPRLFSHTLERQPNRHSRCACHALTWALNLAWAARARRRKSPLLALALPRLRPRRHRVARQRRRISVETPSWCAPNPLDLLPPSSSSLATRRSARPQPVVPPPVELVFSPSVFDPQLATSPPAAGHAGQGGAGPGRARPARAEFESAFAALCTLSDLAEPARGGLAVRSLARLALYALCVCHHPRSDDRGPTASATPLLPRPSPTSIASNAASAGLELAGRTPPSRGLVPRAGRLADRLFRPSRTAWSRARVLSARLTTAAHSSRRPRRSRDELRGTLRARLVLRSISTARLVLAAAPRQPAQLCYRIGARASGDRAQLRRLCDIGPLRSMPGRDHPRAPRDRERPVRAVQSPDRPLPCSPGALRRQQPSARVQAALGARAGGVAINTPHPIVLCGSQVSRRAAPAARTARDHPGRGHPCDSSAPSSSLRRQSAVAR